MAKIINRALGNLSKLSGNVNLVHIFKHNLLLTISYTIFVAEPNKDKTEHSNGTVPSGDGGGGGVVVNHSPKSCGMLSPGSGAPPGSVALPGLTGHRGHDNGVSVTVSNGNTYNGTGRTVYSPEADSPPTPQPPPAPGWCGGSGTQ